MVTQFASIEGQVRDSRTHAPIPFARVELWQAQLPVDQQATDKEGRFRFAALAQTRFTILVDYPGFDSASVEFDARMTSSRVTIELTRRKEVSSRGSPVVSLREYLAPQGALKEFERARKAAKREDCSSAVSHFEQGLRIFDEDAAAHNDLGNCYRKLGQLDLAEASFKRAGALSDSVYISLNLAEVFTTQNRFAEAEAVLNQAIRKQPNAGDAFYGLALAYFEQGHIDEAEKAALDADSRIHRIADLHMLLAKIYLRKQNAAALIEQLESYLEEAPNGPQSEEVRQDLKRFRSRQ